MTGTIHLVTGPWSSGKTSVVAELPRFIPECVVFDWDLIIPGLSLTAKADVHTEPSTWPGLRATWAAILSSIVAGGRDAVLLGPVTTNDFTVEELGTPLIRCAYLDWPDETITGRLQARGILEAEIADELLFLAQLRDAGYYRIAAAGHDPEEVAKLVAVWIGEAGQFGVEG